MAGTNRLAEEMVPDEKYVLNLEVAECALAQKNYVDYVRMAHEGRWIRSRFGLFLCNEVQAFVEKKSYAPYEILVISVPPQHGKSITVTETLPSWFLGKNPHDRVIEISYSESFARRFGRRNREKIAAFGKKIFGIDLATRPNSETDFELSNHVGGMISRGLGSAITGFKADLMIIDDPIKNRQEADSETTRERIWNEWQDTYRSRLSPGAKVIIIQTRWHEDDFAGRIINKEQNVHVINLPCEAEDNDPLGRKPGEALHPEADGKDDEWLRQFKESIIKTEGSRTWYSLYQGRPVRDEGNMISRSWWQFYETLPPQMLQVMSVDATFKDGKNSDFVAIQVWGKFGANYYLLARHKERMDFTTTVARIKYMRAQHPQIAGILVEDKANGSAIINVLQKEIPGVVAIQPQGGKVARVNAVSPAIESGNVWLPKGAPWVGEFIDEFAAFPHGAHDDEVDCCSQALNRLIYTYADITEAEEVDKIFSSTKEPVIGVRVEIEALFGKDVGWL